MPSIESLTVTYDALNEDATFSEGDRLTGKVTLVLSKETEVEEFFVKAKGDARVHWTERRNERTHSYSAHRRFFKLKHFFVPENKKGTVLPAGIHIHNFSFNIPSVGMPSSFKGIHGKIVYMLEAKVSRSWRMDSTAERELKFVSKCFPNIQHLMLQQVGSTDKEMGFFSKGHVHMDATVDRKAYAPGEVVCIVAKVNNSSSKDMTPKFSLKQNVLYHAQGHKKYKEKSVSRAVGEVIRANQEKTVHCALKIPADEILTIQNCDIISVEYHLKVSLDISFSFDPEVSFPIVLLSKTCLPGGAMGPNPAGAVGGPRKSDFPPPTMSTGPSYPVSPGRGAYGYPGAQSYPANPFGYPNNPPVHPSLSGMYPDIPAHVAGGYNNPVPRSSSLYGSPFSSSASSPVHHPPPTAPALHPSPSAPAIPLPPSAPAFQPPPYAPANPSPPTAPDLQPPPYNSSVSVFMPSSLATMNTNFLSQSDEAPPAYMSLFPPNSTEQSTTGSDAK